MLTKSAKFARHLLTLVLNLKWSTNFEIEFYQGRTKQYNTQISYHKKLYVNQSLFRIPSHLLHWIHSKPGKCEYLQKKLAYLGHTRDVPVITVDSSLILPKYPTQWLKFFKSIPHLYSMRIAILSII